MMKWILTLTLALSAFILPQLAHAVPIGEDAFAKVIYVTSAAESPSPSASNTGRDYGSPKPLTNGTVLLAIPANVIITNVYVMVDEAVAGLSAFNIGDADNTSGFIASSSPQVALASTGLNYWDVAYKGAYLKDSSVVSGHWAAKFYSATGKNLTLSLTGTASRGQLRVFVTGYSISKL